MSRAVQPVFNQLWRYRGENISARGMTYRVLRCSWKEICAVHNSPIPNYSWLGDTEDFMRDFIYVCDAGAYRNRQKGWNILGW